MNIKSLAYSLCGPALLSGLLIISLFGGCRQNLDPQLLAVDSMMEEHPDSALMILDDYRLTAPSSAADSAFYALLLTHARYKNFIDETDDSLISRAADYFLKHNDKERASRSLFMQGMIQMNSNRLGEAAVSFKKGLDIAREGRRYMWEGQCARGLFSIYGKIKNHSEQIRYAQVEYDAFVKGDYQDWANYAKLNILRAYHNNERYDKVLEDAFILLKTAEEAKDTILMEEVLVLIGSCQYATGDFSGSLYSYCAAYSLDPSVITPAYGYNVAVAAANIERESLTKETMMFINAVTSRKETFPAFKVLAAQGRFEEAFNGLERYKNLQDSVLQVIIQNNVSESIGHYEDTMAIIHQQEKRTERILWISGLLILAIFIGISYWVYKKNISQKELERKRLEMSMEILQTELGSQIAHMDSMSEDLRRLNTRNEHMSTVLRDLLYDRYKKINDLCDSYYQDRLIESKKKKLAKEMENLLKDFSNHNFLNEIGRYIDMCLDGLYTSFINDFPNLNADSKRLFMFLTLGLSNRSICVILDLENSNLYNRKSRLKKFISGSDAVRKQEYIKNIQ